MGKEEGLKVKAESKKRKA